MTMGADQTPPLPDIDTRLILALLQSLRANLEARRANLVARRAAAGRQ